jgi:hypothetical protein
MHSHLITNCFVEIIITFDEIHIRTPAKVQKCLCFQKETSSVYDYRGKNLYSINFPCIPSVPFSSFRFSFPFLSVMIY